MGQAYPGSNNLKIFKTIGQFGSRYCSKDAALGRHISASLSELTTLLFPPEDEFIL